jgi:hypothetical protein
LDGRIKFDNNLTENAIRPAKLGHKNWMFIGGAHTGWRSAARAARTLAKMPEMLC